MFGAGSLIGGKYELIRLIGKGSMGEVWAATHRSLGQGVAIKLLSGASCEGEEPTTTAARFRFEAHVAARLSRKTRHIVRVTDHGEDDGVAYLVMELLEGQSLETRLLHMGRLTCDETAAVVAQIARALTEAHAAGFVHRDLKPANIFLTRDEEGALLVKLLDFGIARTMHTHRVMTPFSTGHGFVFGTPGYMSPEQATPSARLDQRCDLWALATVAYQMMTAELPVLGTSTQELLNNVCAGRIMPIHERAPELPAALGGFFQKAFAPRIDHRYTSAVELAEAFARAAASVNGPSVAPATTEMPRLRRYSLFVVASAVSLLGLALAGGILLRHAAGAQPGNPVGLTPAKLGLSAPADLPVLPPPPVLELVPSNTIEDPTAVSAAREAAPPALPVSPPAPSPPASSSAHRPLDRSDIF
jgi:serine/threonine protein kinase